MGMDMKGVFGNRITVFVITASILLFILLVGYILYSLCHWDIEYRFGNNYVLCAHGEIFYIDNNTNKTYFNVIPYGVKKYNSNKRWIIAQTTTGFIYSRDSSQIAESKVISQSPDFDPNRITYSILKPNTKDSLDFRSYKESRRYDAYWIIDKSIPINTSDSSNYCLLYYSSKTPLPILCPSLIGPLSLEEFNKARNDFKIDLELTKVKR